MKDLYDFLDSYTQSEVCPFHMPGHKRNTLLLGNKLPYNIDITEIDGFDNLSDPKGILKSCGEEAAQLYGSKSAYLLVNGSTGGILAGISAAVNKGDKIIMARNCHKSVYNGAAINCLKTEYLVPDRDENGICGSITPEQVERALNSNSDAKLVIITSPTYEGVISDVKKIVQVAHNKGVPVLVDAAHGAHLGFSEMFYGDTVKSGADIVITSLHKTLPALTQCGLALFNGGCIRQDKFAEQLTVFQTSSPSYILMASIDHCLKRIKQQKVQLFKKYEENLKLFYKKAKDLKNLYVIDYKNNCFFGFDPGKLIVMTRGLDITGSDLGQILRSKYKIEIEMAYSDYIIAMTSICDTKDSFERLINALAEIDKKVGRIESKKDTIYTKLIQKEPIYKALQTEGKLIDIDKAVKMMSLEYVWAYPPGIPIIVPGEIIDESAIKEIKDLVKKGINLKSTRGYIPHRITAV